MFKKILILLLLCLVMTSCNTTGNSKNNTDVSNNDVGSTNTENDNEQNENIKDDENDNNNEQADNNDEDSSESKTVKQYNDYLNSLTESNKEIFYFLSNAYPESITLKLSTPVNIDKLYEMGNYLPTLKRNIHFIRVSDDLNDNQISAIESLPRTEFSDRLNKEVILFNNDTSYDRVIDEDLIIATNDDEIFGYNRLDDEQKQLYDKLAGDSITEDNPYYFDSPQSFKKIKIVTSLYRSNNILLSWSSSYRNYFIITDDNDKAIGIELKYGTADKNNEMTDKFNQKVEEALESFPKEYKNDEEKIKAITTYMSKTVKYYMPYGGYVDPYTLGEKGATISSNLENEYGAIVNGKCECYGFAYAFKFFAEKLGMKCDAIYLTEYAGEKTVQRHCKNLIEIDGIYYTFEPQLCTWIANNKNSDFSTLYNYAIKKSTPELFDLSDYVYSYSCDELYNDKSNIFTIRYTK